ncbi:uncharacterized protein LOC144663339 isoform X10 [Oculina patagonica]
MERKSNMERKPGNRSTSERFRFVAYFVAIACLFSCIVVLFVLVLSMERRSALYENNFVEIFKELKSIRSEFDAEKSFSAARHKRSASPTTSLSDITKRLAALETRTVNLSKVLRMKTSLRGRDGRDGREGTAGPRGLTGPKGDVGRTGSIGPQGPPGPQGAKGPEGQGLSGVSYNRWGRTNCSGDATVVYTGAMGGGYYTHTGGGTNYVCLTNNPIYDKYESGWQGTAAMYGTEYQTSFAGFRRGDLMQHDAPCAVCYVKSRGSQMMIPGTNKCPSGWTREYYGYLMTSHYNHAHQSEFVCVDVDAEVTPGTHKDTDGALLYIVEGDCRHALPCKPYIHGYELTCVVCTK